MQTSTGVPVRILCLNHMKAHADVMELLDSAVKRLDDLPSKGRVVVKVDMGRVIGRSGCVETTSADDVVFVKRPGRRFPSRCVRGRVGDETSTVTMVLNISKTEITLVTAYIGYPAPREVGDPSMNVAERIESERFWSNHALVI